jgi:hypothetical protein
MKLLPRKWLGKYNAPRVREMAASVGGLFHVRPRPAISLPLFGDGQSSGLSLALKRTRARMLFSNPEPQLFSRFVKI